MPVKAGMTGSLRKKMYCLVQDQETRSFIR